MKTVVIDTNELRKEWLLKGLKYQLLEHMQRAGGPWFDVYIPRIVLEELVANHAREVAKVEAAGEQLNRDRRIVGLSAPTSDPLTFDYRAYVEERFLEHLGFTVLPWTEVPHEEVAMRAVNRTPPFNEKGTGYRDALVWTDVVELARRGRDVSLVSMDKAFAGEGDVLAPELQAEVEPLAGSVQLVRDFNRWLITALPWKSVTDLASAVAHSRDAEFYDYYLKSDFQDGLEPTVEELGLRWAPYKFELVDVAWSGDFVPVGGSAMEDGTELVEYELGQTVEFKAEFPEGIAADSGWDISQPDFYGRVQVEGSIEMVLRVAVLFGEDEVGFSIEELSWRRADGGGLGAAVYRPDLDPNQPSLFGGD